MTRKRSKDPVTAATTSFLWPYLKSKGFVKSTTRNFSKEVNGFFQQVWIDANGFSGKESVRVHYNVMPVADANVASYSVGDCIDSWDMSTYELADESMQDVVVLLGSELLPKMDSFSNYESYITQFIEYGSGNDEYKQSALSKMSRWKTSNFDAEELEKIDANRKKLKL